MELDKVEALLEKYFRGEMNLAEEKALKDYFSSRNVAPSLEHYIPMFGYFDEAKKETSRVSFKLKKKKNKTLLWLGFVASVLVLLSVGFYTFTKSKEGTNDLGTFENPEIAFKETQKALNLISKNLNIGIESMQYINEFEQSKNKIFK